MRLLTVFYSPRGTCSFLRKSDSRGNGSDRLIFQFVSGSKASVFVRKALSVRLRDQRMRMHSLSSEVRTDVFR